MGASPPDYGAGLVLLPQDEMMYQEQHTNPQALAVNLTVLLKHYPSEEGAHELMNHYPWGSHTA